MKPLFDFLVTHRDFGKIFKKIQSAAFVQLYERIWYYDLFLVLWNNGTLLCMANFLVVKNFAYILLNPK